MRTTIDLPEPLHRIARSLALHTGRTLSETVAELVQRGLDTQATGPADASGARSAKFDIHPQTGLPVARSKRVVTPHDIAELEDEA